MKTYYPNFTIVLLFVLVIYGCQSDDEGTLNENSSENLEEELKVKLIEVAGSITNLTLPKSDEYTLIPNDPNNSITQEKVVLGQLLFHETEIGINPRLSMGAKTYSCASCHHAKAGFQSGMKQGIGEGGFGFGSKGENRAPNSFYPLDSIDVQPIRSPTILNTAYQDVMLWNGQFGATGTNSGTESRWTAGTPKEKNNLGFQGLEIQAIAGLGVHRLNIDTAMVKNSSYKTLFDQAFPNDVENERYTLINAGLAIAAYERTVLANRAPFQKFLTGEEHGMSDDELNGALLFFGKAKCYTCHSGPGLNGMDFHALGMNDLAGNDVVGTVDPGTAKGRGGFTNDPKDDYKFKTPTLYNLKDVEFLGHGGSFSSVKDVIEYKNDAIVQNNTVPFEKISVHFNPLGLTEQEVDQLSLFIQNSLYDNELERYVPLETPLGSKCFPNADAQSKEDMGCD